MLQSKKGNQLTEKFSSSDSTPESKTTDSKTDDVHLAKPHYTFQTEPKEEQYKDEGFVKLVRSMEPPVRKMFFSIFVLQFFHVLLSVSLGVAGETLTYEMGLPNTKVSIFTIISASTSILSTYPVSYFTFKYGLQTSLMINYGISFLGALIMFLAPASPFIFIVGFVLFSTSLQVFVVVRGVFANSFFPSTHLVQVLTFLSMAQALAACMAENIYIRIFQRKGLDVLRG